MGSSSCWGPLATKLSWHHPQTGQSRSKDTAGSVGMVWNRIMKFRGLQMSLSYCHNHISHTSVTLVCCSKQKGTGMIKTGFSTSKFSCSASFEKDCRYCIISTFVEIFYLKKCLIKESPAGIDLQRGVIWALQRALEIEEGKCSSGEENTCLFRTANVKRPSVLETQKTVDIELIFSLKIF